jgi:uncharacterized protein DUF4169
MGDVVNLRIQRKRTERLVESKFAAQQRVKHGVAKQQRALAKAVEDKSRRDMIQQRLDSGETQ